MDDRFRECVHYLGNELQKVLGYIELDECEKAKPHVKEALKRLHELRKLLTKK